MTDSIITAEREAKGDLHITRNASGSICRASLDDKSILAMLVKRRFLGFNHIEAAATYCLWQHAFQKPFYAEPRRAYMIEIAGGQGNGSNDECRYRYLLRKLNRLDQHIVDRCIMGDWSEIPERQQDHTAKQAVVAFNALIAVIEHIVENNYCDIENKPCAKQ